MLEHEDAVADRQGARRPPSPMTDWMIGTSPVDISMMLRAMASACPVLGIDPWVSAGVSIRVRSGARTVGQVHQAKGLSVAVRPGHSEVSMDIFMVFRPSV